MGRKRRHRRAKGLAQRAGFDEQKRHEKAQERALSRLTAVRRQVAELERRERVLGAEAARVMTWTELGSALGMTRQGAQQRYGGAAIGSDGENRPTGAA